MGDLKDDKATSLMLLPVPNVPALVRASVVAAGLAIAAPGCGGDTDPMPPSGSDASAMDGNLPPMPGPSMDADMPPPMPPPVMDADMPDGDPPPMPPPPMDADMPDGPIPPMPPPMDSPPPMPGS